METTYVTIQEFLENGGKLETGRDIYEYKSDDSIEPEFVGRHFYLGGQESEGKFWSFLLTDGTKVVKEGYVKIEVRKIYK
jgi:hypothetical protein